MGGILDKALIEQTSEGNCKLTAECFGLQRPLRDSVNVLSSHGCGLCNWCRWVTESTEEVICKLFQLVASRYSLLIIILNSHYLLYDKEHWHQDCCAELNITELYCNQRAANVCVPDIFTRCCELGSRGSVLSLPNTVFLNYQHAHTSCIADWNL